MKKHKGMRPHDIPILLKIIAKGKQTWHMKDLAYELEISASEISESINRSVIAGLIGSDKKSIKKLALMDFLRYGLRYVFPQQPGALVRGMLTAHSAPPLDEVILSHEKYVWPYAQGTSRGQALEPLHPQTPQACLKDGLYYELMALLDALRVGKTREQKLAFQMIKERIENTIG